MEFDEGADFVPLGQAPRESHSRSGSRSYNPHGNMSGREDGPHEANGGPPPSEVSPTRLYLGNIPKNATREDILAHFNKKHGVELKEVKLMNGFAFIEYSDPLDARDVVPAFHGTTFMGQRLIVQFARGSRRNDQMGPNERMQPRPRRTVYQVLITNLPPNTSWQDLKDFARQSNLDVVHSDVDRNGKGTIEFETAADMNTAVDKLNQTEFDGSTVNVVANQQDERPRDNRGRSRSPLRRNYPPRPRDDYGYDRPRRGYSPGPEYGRRRTPPPQRGWDERDYYARGPPPRGPPMPDYGRRPYPDDGYGPPPPRGRYDEPPYGGGGYGGPPPRGYGGPPPPRRGYTPPRNGHDGGYSNGGRW